MSLWLDQMWLKLYNIKTLLWYGPDKEGNVAASMQGWLRLYHLILREDTSFYPRGSEYEWAQRVFEIEILCPCVVAE